MRLFTSLADKVGQKSGLLESNWRSKKNKSPRLFKNSLGTTGRLELAVDSRVNCVV